jgi:hypothetical protein
MTSLNRSSDTNCWLSRNPIALLSFSQCIKVEEEQYVGRRRTPWSRLLPYLGKLYSLDSHLQSWSTGLLIGQGVSLHAGRLATI